MQRADLLGVFDVNGESLRDVEQEFLFFGENPSCHQQVNESGGRARIRTRVAGLEGQHDIPYTTRPSCRRRCPFVNPAPAETPLSATSAASTVRLIQTHCHLCCC